MKKSTKIILPALAVLVLGTAAAATGTVAWFAANGVVSATGMQVQCATSKNLLIINNDPSKGTAEFTDGNFGATAVTKTTGIKELSPASTSATLLKTTENFYKAGNSQINAVSGGLKTGATIVDAIAATGTGKTTGDYVKHEFWVANSATEDMALSVRSLTATKTVTDEDGKTSEVALTGAITKALRVAVVYKDLTKSGDAQMVANIYSVVDGATTTYQGLVGKTATSDGITATTPAVKEGETVLSEETKCVLYSGATDAQKSLGLIKCTNFAVESDDEYIWTTLNVFVWYEGQDAACTSNNAMSVEQVNLSLEFEAKQAA